MHRGVEVGIFLRPGLEEEAFVAQALGNLSAYRLQVERKEPLEWQVLRIDTSAHQHHYRIVLRHPQRLLDVGFKSGLEAVLRDLSDESVDQLRGRLRAAESEGLRVVPLRVVHEAVDYWRDDFWTAIGGPSGIAPPGTFP
ncbi:MAG: hypothetical protein ACREBZ_05195 [Thermoplasmata archaeon]